MAAPVKNCQECANTQACLERVKNGVVVYCGSSMCRPKPKEEATP